ncbi:MAG: hypothetical protein GX121_09435 [Ignavibacteria bacterium]|jgi:hypothetical protein|nr:hypothetical protein [Ignavibacteria bacterium]
MTLEKMIDEINTLPIDDLFKLNDFLNCRVKEFEKNNLIKTVIESREEHKNGLSKKATVDEIMNEILT